MVKYNKKSLANDIAMNNGISVKQANMIVDDLFDTIIEHVKKDGSVDITGFGKFVLKHSEAKQAINPKTKETVIAKEKYSVSFKPSQLFKDDLQ